MHPGSRRVTFVGVNLRTYQSCYSNDGWQAVRIQSDSDPRITYTVHVSPWKADESICECPAWMFNFGKCKHQPRAWEQVCRWTGSPTEPRHHACPACGGPLKLEIEETE